jgi:hypothetical protein
MRRSALLIMLLLCSAGGPAGCCFPYGVRRPLRAIKGSAEPSMLQTVVVFKVRHALEALQLGMFREQSTPLRHSEHTGCCCATALENTWPTYLRQCMRRIPIIYRFVSFAVVLLSGNRRECCCTTLHGARIHARVGLGHRGECQSTDRSNHAYKKTNYIIRTLGSADY